ncbi:acetyltransferase, GNAT family [Mediterraneibacter gnavus ATCC 29149]|uniref:Acetyltransferase, GNAT family n=1 Tax=Mediterraneibacter gnavus (strain ATCC 29149 / DSM 114966 / JCM 6515 / VPI C7-9) TaxID=411470 RepID=A7B220_MEDG7|nr:acetyltransferase, GNAT family [Mediterraneibacter gnavus ATCC 29149]
MITKFLKTTWTQWKIRILPQKSYRKSCSLSKAELIIKWIPTGGICMELREYTDFNQEEILSLYTSVGWENYTRNPQMLERAYENSFLKIAAFEGKQLIGMVRVVGDGASVILIQDLLVRPEYQRKGIGSQLMRAVLERCEDVYQIELMTDNTEKTILFYQSLGLKKVDEIGCCAFLKM